MIDRILSIVGLVSLVTVVIRVFWMLFSTNTEWASDVCISEIKDLKMSEIDREGNCVFPEEYCTEESQYTTRLMFRPYGSIIKKMTLSQIEYKNDNFTRFKRINVKVFRNITPQRPLIVSTDMAETFPRYVLSWKGDYGIKAAYYFCMNARDRNYQSSGMTYTINLWTKIRKILGLK